MFYSFGSLFVFDHELYLYLLYKHPKTDLVFKPPY